MEWGTLDYYIDRISSPTPPLHIDICDPNLTDEDVIRFANALTTTQNGGDGEINEGGGTTLKKLRLRGSQITSRGFLALAEAISGMADSTSTLEELDLGYNMGITDDVDDFAFGLYLLLSAAKNLKHLDLEGSCIGRRAGMALGDLVAIYGQVLETLNLHNNALEDDSMIYLASKLVDCKLLKRLDLGFNYVGPSGAMALADFMATNPRLQHLILLRNSIRDSGAMYFAKAMKSNTSLRELNLGYNQISSVGLEALLYAIFNTSSLNSLVGSNHTICCLFQQHSVEDLLRRRCDVHLLFHIDSILQLNKLNALLDNSSCKLPYWAADLPLSTLSIEKLKVVIYLCKCFDMKHFLALDRTMMPQALAFVASHLGQDNVFHLISRWYMPELSSQTLQPC